VAIGRDTGKAAQTVYTMLETTRYLQTQSANEGAVCLFTEPSSNPNQRAMGRMSEAPVAP